MKKKILALLAVMLVSLTASAQNIVGLWRWTTDPGAYKFMEFRANGTVGCRDYATFSVEEGYNTIYVTGWLRWEATYRKSGSQLTINNKPATAKVELVDLEVVPEVPQSTYNKIKASVKKQLDNMARTSIHSKPERYRIDVFTDELLQMQLGNTMVYYYRTNSYNVDE